MQNYNKIFNRNDPNFKREDVGLKHTKKENRNVIEEKKESSGPEVKEVPKLIKAKVANCKQLNVRDGAGKKNNVVCVLSEGDLVTICPIYNVDIDDEWTHVQLKDGIKGYVMGMFLKEV